MTDKKNKLETKASSRAGQRIPAGCRVTLPRTVLITINVKKTVSLKHSVRAILGHRSKKANINLVRRRDEIDYLLLQVDVVI